jgi:molybdate transport system permease protein
MKRIMIWHGAAFPLVLFVVFFLLPVLAVIIRAPWINPWANPVIMSAVKVSFTTSICSTLIFLILGIPAAYFLARVDFIGKKVLGALLELPMVLNPPL